MAIRQTAQDGQPRKLEYRDLRPDAAQRSSELRFTRCEGGDVLVVRQDTSERTLAAERIERLAYYDPLTGLPNRLLCMQMAEKSIEEAGAQGEGLAVIYLDLKSFKRVNDAFGHSVGDMVLKRVAEKLSQTIESFPFSRRCGIARPSRRR